MMISLHLDISNLPDRLVWDRPVSDTQLEALCEANDLLCLERTTDGAIRVNPPTGLSTSHANSGISYELVNWQHAHQSGMALGSSAGFYLKDGSMLNPDAAYISPERLNASGPMPHPGFPHLCPDFIIELLSDPGRLGTTQQKMEQWIANGVLLGWLVDPYQRNVTVYVTDKPPTTVTGDSITGSYPVAGFKLDLNEVWNSYQ